MKLWVVVLLSALLMLYSFLTLKSVICNSDICLELYKLSSLSVHTALVYLSYISLLLCIPLFFLRAGMNAFSGHGRIAYSMVVGLFLVGIGAIYGLDKEKNKLDVWARRLAIDRDLSLEVLLNHSEKGIETDEEIVRLIEQNAGSPYLVSYIQETYFPLLEQDYEIAALGITESNSNPEIESIIDENTGNGVPISPGSRFHFAASGAGRIRYTALFEYRQSPTDTLKRLLLGVEYKINNENRGYASILGIIAPGKVEIPPFYSYAKYNDDNLQFFKGSYPYPTKMNESLLKTVFVDKDKYKRMEGYLHFPTRVNENETVLISRPAFNFINYLHAIAFVSVITFLLLTAVPSLRKRRIKEEKSYYRRRISIVLMVAMTLSLVLLTLVSIYFVNSRNEDNMRAMMSDKINSMRSLIESQMSMAPMGPDGVQLQDINAILSGVAEISNTDISLYDNSGRLMTTTGPEPLNQVVLSGRINSVAYNSICNQSRRYFVQREKIRGKKFYSMYAPILNQKGHPQAIICAPYTDNSFDFQQDAVMHAAAIFTVFLILLLLARVISSTILDRLFSPLSEMGRKMKQADIDHLEHIEYSRNDEISSLVISYNRMVDDLSESSQKLLQAEREKAWNGMARQVAHEIKNPLTPMKLQIQRLIRLKHNGDPKWVEKFDEVTSIVLEHIDILTDTANEFSELAKLPTEKFTDIDFATLLQEETNMFDNREDISFEYIGLDSALVSGPKPQLTRVIVNLLTNAVQAVEEREAGKILVTLRNSSTDGYYEMTVEDNGEGVSEENLGKLFVPSFTTKSGGSGLGLAISRSILDRCNAMISYSRSFSLGGACFTIKYPVK